MTTPDPARRRTATRELRTQLADVLRRAAGGETTVITSRGRAVAEIGPVGAPGAHDLDTLAAAGLLAPPPAEQHPAPPAPATLPIDVSLDRLIDERRP